MGIENEGLSDLKLRDSDCISEYRIDQYYLCELPKGLIEDVESHLKTCASCRRSLEIRKGEFTQFPEVDIESMVKEIHSGTAGIELKGGESKSGLWENLGAKWLGSAIIMGAGLAVVMFFIQPGFDGRPAYEVVREKGGGPKNMTINVFRKTEGGSEKVVAGSKYRVGDIIRFEMGLLNSGYMMLVTKNSSGVETVLYSARNATSIRNLENFRQLTPKAYSIDEANETDWVFLIQCRRAFRFDELSFTDLPGEVLLPEGCSFVKQELVTENKSKGYRR